MPTVVNCRRRRRTLRDTTSALSHTLLDIPRSADRRRGVTSLVTDLGRRQGRVSEGGEGLVAGRVHAAQRESQCVASAVTRPVHEPAIMSRHSSNTSSSP